MADIQSIGADIQSMLLVTQANGLGSLWVCDILTAEDAQILAEHN